MAKSPEFSDKKKIIPIIALICLIIAATICVLLLTPFGKQLLGIGKNGEPISTSQTEITSAIDKTTENGSKATFIAPDDMPSVSVPEPTSPDVDTDKNYSIFADKKVFDVKEAEGTTTLTAKDNNNVIISVTPYKNVSYQALCTDTVKVHERSNEQPKLNVESLYAAFYSDMNGTTTTVYCIDDGNGGSIKLKYERPSNTDQYDKDFEIAVSMFKVK